MNKSRINTLIQEQGIIIIAGSNGAGRGGHDIPEDVIRRRYEAGWTNFQQLYKKLVDTWVLYDNSGETPVLVDAGGKS